jgi:hypothetical protein
MEYNTGNRRAMITSIEEERLLDTFMVKEIKRLLADRVEFKVVLIKRDQIMVSRALANMGRSEPLTDFWFRTGPNDIPGLCIEDCNPGD